jgi:O-succinylbenzoate synthase
MRIWVHRYELQPKGRLGVARPGPRPGALLRIGDGFADLHPWPELGDAPREEQLAILAGGGRTPLLDSTLRLAAADAEARRRGASLFDGLEIPASHWPGDDPPAGFDTVKIKGTHSHPEGVRLRIDCNATLSEEQFVEAAAALPADRIDFVEDPCPYVPDVWRRIRARTGLTLALDLAPGRRESGTEDPAFEVLIHKPAVQPVFPTFAGEVVVTSYMDHPVGQFGAAWVAASNRVSRRCGLFTHVLFENDPFIETVAADGARLRRPEGSGIGFDILLERLPWKRL